MFPAMVLDGLMTLVSHVIGTHSMNLQAAPTGLLIQEPTVLLPERLVASAENL
jgi:predicted benzoate:H+ symporter BenE